MRTNILKVCGNHTKSDIIALNKTMPKFCGFVFYPPSKRYVTPNKAKWLIKNLDKNIIKVGVFVNEDIKTIIKTCIKCKLDIAQLHGDEDVDYCNKLKHKIKTLKLNIKITKVFRLQKRANLGKKEINTIKNNIVSYAKSSDYFLFDTFVSGYGGEAKSFEWSILDCLKDTLRLLNKQYFLAGGINELNIKRALKIKSNFIDIASGVESKNHTKNIQKIKAIQKHIKYSLK